MLVGTKTNRFAIPQLEGELTDAVIDDCGLRKGLEQFGKQLIEQMSGQEIVGIDFKNISFVANLKAKSSE